MANEKEIRVGRFVATMVHLTPGWRWWARSSGQGENRLPDLYASDSFWGLSPSGYDDAGAARKAMAKAERNATPDRIAFAKSLGWATSRTEEEEAMLAAARGGPARHSAACSCSRCLSAAEVADSIFDHDTGAL